MSKPKTPDALSREYLEASLTQARKVLPHKMYAAIFQAARASSGGKATQNRRREALDKAHLEDAQVLYVSAIDDWDQKTVEAFDTIYKARGPVYSVDDIEWITDNKGALHVVALGRDAETVLKATGVACSYVPPPNLVALRKIHPDQVQRKLTAIVDKNNTLNVNSGLPAKVCKTDQAKQIVYSVVLDPYQFDAHEDWTPPADIEKTAHEYLQKSRVVGYEHTKLADAQVVESWIERYPSAEDYQKAHKNEAHNAYKLPFGTDTVHSGAWVLGVQLGDKEWAEVQKGELDAFSIGAEGYRSAVEKTTLPDVTFIDLSRPQ